MTDIAVKQGNDKRIIARVTDQAGVAVDISGAQEITWSVAEDINSAAVLTKTLTGEEISIAGTDAFTFDITQVDSAAFSVQGYYHEALVITADGKAYTSLSGSLNIQATLIKPE
jgi:hypothetical protein